MARNLRDRACDYLAYARRHPGDCLLHSFKRHKLLKELEGLAATVSALEPSLESEAYVLQDECVRMLWDGYFGLKSWYYITSTSKLEFVKCIAEEEVAKIKEMLE